MPLFNTPYVDLGGVPIPPPTSWAPNSIWTKPLSEYTSLELDPNNDVLVAALIAQARDPIRVPWLQAGRGGMPIVEVPPDQPRVQVSVINGNQPFYAPLQAAFNADGGVPIPPDAPVTATSDSAVVVYQESTDSYWELWVGKIQPGGSWTCRYGGVTKQFSQNVGHFGPSDFPGLSTYSWGTSATSILIAPGLTRINEMRNGEIPHAISMYLGDVRADRWAWPAQRSDGSLLGIDKIPYGAHFRLDPTFDTSTIHRYSSRVWAKAMQKYGAIIRERTHFALSIDCEYDTVTNWLDAMQVPITSGTAFGDVIQGIPWERMQLLKMDLRNHTGPPAP